MIVWKSALIYTFFPLRTSLLFAKTCSIAFCFSVNISFEPDDFQISFSPCKWVRIVACCDFGLSKSQARYQNSSVEVNLMVLTLTNDLKKIPSFAKEAGNIFSNFPRIYTSKWFIYNGNEGERTNLQIPPLKAAMASLDEFQGVSQGFEQVWRSS